VAAGFGLMQRVRSGVYVAYFYAVTLAFGLAGLAVRRFAPGRALAFAQAWVATLLAGLGPICGIRIVVTGLANLPHTGPALLASQHQSEFDTLVWMRLLRRPSYVMKQELTETPLVGPMLVPAGMIPVDRAGGAAALRRLLLDTEAARDQGRQIVIFPEGTRVAPGERVALQPGIAAVAQRLGLPVIPVATDSGLCWTRSRMAMRAGTIHVEIGPPISCSAKRDQLLAEVEMFWRQAEKRGFKPVDKSVEQVVREPLARAAEAR
jgi:1-acyl-sn-glycerol-3-phosphate acyltransferase